MLESMSGDTFPGLYEARVLWIGRTTWEWNSSNIKSIANGGVTINKMSVLMFSRNWGNNTSFSNFYNQNGHCSTYIHELCHVYCPGQAKL